MQTNISMASYIFDYLFTWFPSSFAASLIGKDLISHNKNFENNLNVVNQFAGCWTCTLLNEYQYLMTF